ncbi:hypothetical protein AURDEDRAFT_110929 [Auricularia subglabra TFB-10046 SS5]|nr:hypothetical protein AURDEDRAFT_110929 [Auricularia subglabra TFB-10046 SS5]
MSRPPSWRLRQAKKRSEPTLSLVFAEPQSSPPAKTAVDTLQAKIAGPQYDLDDPMAPIPSKRSSSSSVRRSPSQASVAASFRSTREPLTRGGSSRSNKRQRLEDDIPPVPALPPPPKTDAGPSAPSAAAATPDASTSAPVQQPQHKSSWFGFGKKASNASLASSARVEHAPSPAAVAVAVVEQPCVPDTVPPAPMPATPVSVPATNVAPTSTPIGMKNAPTATPLSPESHSSSLPTRRGWFGFGGNAATSSGPDATSSASLPEQPLAVKSPEPLPKPDAIAPVTPPPTPPRRDPSPARSEPIPISSPKSNNDEASSSRRAGWFGSIGRSSHKPNASVASLAMSIDSHAPTPDRAASPPPLPPAAQLVAVQQQTLSTMNSSAPRYTLTIPLLGRSKVPLDAIAKVEKKSGPEVMEVDMSALDAVTPTNMTVAEDKDKTPEGKEVVPSVRDARQESSWLTYLWPVASVSAPAIGETQSLPASPVKPTADLPPSPAMSSPDLPSLPSGSSAAPVKSAETRRSVWYSPWTWETAEETSTEAPASEPAILEPKPPRTESPEPEPQSPRHSDAGMDTNPLMRTAEQRASWVTYFTGRGRAPTARKMYDENGGMEVMDLDDEPPTVTMADPPLGNGNPTKRNTTATGSTEPPSGKQRAQPITESQSVRQSVRAASLVPRPASPAPSSSSKKGKSATAPPTARAPNLVLPTFDDTFKTEPRRAPPPAPSALRRTLGMVRDSLFSRTESHGEHHDVLRRSGLVFEGHHKRGDRRWAKQLPRAWSVLGGAPAAGDGASEIKGLLQGCKRVVVIGVHGWFPGAIMRTMFGEPTGTSSKFATMMEAAVSGFMQGHGHALEKLTTMPLEGEGTIERRVEKLYENLMAREEWVEDLHMADVVFVATHSQGSVASTHLLRRLIHEGHIRIAPDEAGLLPTNPTMPTWTGVGSQRVCCLALCGIHLGPLTYLHSSSIVQPYLQYFESAAARELFEFQDTNSAVSRSYFEALSDVLSHGVRFVYIASLDDQVVPIYSGTFGSISHPLILRALYIDGDAYSSSDFLSNLLILLLRLRNAGIDDAGLIAHLSEATAGSLSGVGHSSAYEELATYSLAVRFMFEASGVLNGPAELAVDHFSPRAPRNDYEIPWALRHILADPRVGELFGHEFIELRAQFDDWQPKTTALKEIRRKLEPIRRISNSRL